MLVLVVAFLAAGVFDLSRTLPKAGQGLIIYAAEQKDLFVDAGLIRESFHVRGPSALEQKLRDETVIVAVRTSPRTAYLGSGVILGTKHGRIRILSAKHIVNRAGQAFVILPDHVVRRALRVVMSHASDLALIEVAGVPLTQYPAARLSPWRFSTGERFVVMGHPGAKSWTSSPGIAERHRRAMLLFCPTCDRGDSGAGAFDRSGVLHGIVVSKAVMSAPSAQTGEYMKIIAFEIEEPESIHAFLRSVR